MAINRYPPSSTDPRAISHYPHTSPHPSSDLSRAIDDFLYPPSFPKPLPSCYKWPIESFWKDSDTWSYGGWVQQQHRTIHYLRYPESLLLSIQKIAFLFAAFNFVAPLVESVLTGSLPPPGWMKGFFYCWSVVVLSDNLLSILHGVIKNVSTPLASCETWGRNPDKYQEQHRQWREQAVPLEVDPWDFNPKPTQACYKASIGQILAPIIFFKGRIAGDAIIVSQIALCILAKLVENQLYCHTIGLLFPNWYREPMTSMQRVCLILLTGVLAAGHNRITSALNNRIVALNEELASLYTLGHVGEAPYLQKHQLLTN